MLAYNASASTIQSALQALPNWDDSNINTITVSGALTSAATFTFAGNWYASEFSYGITPISLVVVGSSVETSAPAIITFATTLSTVPNNGFSSASYQVSIYSSIFRALTMDKDGNMEVLDLTNRER